MTNPIACVSWLDQEHRPLNSSVESVEGLLMGFVFAPQEAPNNHGMTIHVGGRTLAILMRGGDFITLPLDRIHFKSWTD